MLGKSKAIILFTLIALSSSLLFANFEFPDACVRWNLKARVVSVKVYISNRLMVITWWLF